jgi:hypothetical protein
MLVLDLYLVPTTIKKIMILAIQQKALIINVISACVFELLLWEIVI